MKVPVPNPRLTQYLIRNAKHYFKEAEEFIALKATYDEMSWWTIFDMASPLITIVIALITKKFPDLFSILGIHKSFEHWVNYFRYLELRSYFTEWKAIVDAVGGPFISTNDPTYMAYVYADGMHRIHTSTFSNVKRRAGHVPT